MMNAQNHDHDRDRDLDQHANDNGNVAPMLSGGAVASLAALGATLNAVDTSSVAGWSGMPMLQFTREGDGRWIFGQRRTVVETNSRWAINVLTFRWGFIAFNDNKKVVGERLVSVAQAKPNIAELPDLGCRWTEQWAVNLKCIDGADADTEVVYKPTTTGGVQAIASLIEAVRDRINGGNHGGKVVPIVHLEKSSYAHSQFGKVWTPLLTIVGWTSLEGPTAAPAPSADQPRRRRSG